MKKLYVRAETAEDHESVSVRESSLLQATQDYNLSGVQLLLGYQQQSYKQKHDGAGVSLEEDLKTRAELDQEQTHQFMMCK